MYSGYCFGKSAWEFVNHNPAAASSDLVVGLICAFTAFLWWLIERKNRRKKRNVLGLLGYKARAAKAKLLANMPQGGRSPGLNPA